MTNLQIYLQCWGKMIWLWLPILILFMYWVLVEAVDTKWETRGKRYGK